MWELKEPPLFTERVTLTDREQELMRLICLGYLQKQIAYGCGISRETVSVHLRNIKTKLGAATTAQAAVMFTLG